MKTCPSCQRTFDDNLRFCQNDGTELIADDPFKTMIAGQPAPGSGDKDPLEIPAFDPNKTSIYSAQDQQDVLSTPDPFAGLPQPEPEPFVPPPPPDAFIPPPAEPLSNPIPPPPSFAEPDQVYQPQPSPFDSPFSPPQQSAGQDWQAPPAPVQQWGDQAAGFGSNTPFQPPGAAAGQQKGLAIASMVCGILSCLCCFSIITGPAGVIMGIMARNKANSDPMTYGGAGMAMAGIITGAIGAVFGTLAIIIQIMGALAR